MKTKEILRKSFKNNLTTYIVCVVSSTIVKFVSLIILTEIIRKIINFVISFEKNEFIAIIIIFFLSTSILAVFKYIANIMIIKIKILTKKNLEDVAIFNMYNDIGSFDTKRRIAEIKKTIGDISDKFPDLIINTVVGIFMLIAVTVYIFKLDFIAVIISYLTCIVSILLSKKKVVNLDEYSKKSQESSNHLFALSWEYLNNAEVSSFLDENKMFNLFNTGIEKNRVDQINFSKRRNFIRIAGRFSYYSNVILYLVYITYRFVTQHSFNAAESTAVIILLPKLTNLLHLLPNCYNDYLSLIGSSKIVDKIIKTDDNIISIEEKFESLTIKNLSFNYSGGNGIYFDSFTTHLAKVTFVVGETGAGKSTFLKLISGRLSDYIGEIYWDNRKTMNVCVNSTAWYKQVLYQDSAVIFNATIQDNITLSNNKLNKELLNQSINKAQLEDFILSQSDDTDLFIKPDKLSDGEKQKIAIARLFYHKHKNFILDEVMSAIDIESQKRILVEFSKMAIERNSLFFLSTHVLSLIDPEDIVIFIDKKGKCHYNTHENLCKENNEYNKFIVRQQ